MIGSDAVIAPYLNQVRLLQATGYVLNNKAQ